VSRGCFNEKPNRRFDGGPIPTGVGVARDLPRRLNGEWHRAVLRLFMVVVLGHWAEHLAQAVQIYVLGWPVPEARGVLGLWYPRLIKSELLHYLYALVMLVGLWTLRDGFGSPVPSSILQLVVPRVELHLFSNTVVFIPMVVGMYYYSLPPEGEEPSRGHTCALRHESVGICSV
jgi:hypothetical protein